MRNICFTDTSHLRKGVRKGGCGYHPPWAWYFTKTFLSAQRILIVFAYILLVNLSSYSNTTELFACKFQGTLWMGQNVIIRFWWESLLSSASRNHLTIFCKPFVHYACFKIVFRDSSLYPNQLCLFYLLCLISACSDRIGYITNFCSMIKMLHELKNSTC